MLDLESEIKIVTSKRKQSLSTAKNEVKQNMNEEKKQRLNEVKDKKQKKNDKKLLKCPPIKFKNDRSYLWKDLMTNIIETLDKDISYTVIDIYGESGYLCYLWKSLRSQDKVIYIDAYENASKINSKDEIFLKDIEIVEEIENVNEVNENTIYLVYNLHNDLTVYEYLDNACNASKHVLFFDNTITCKYLETYKNISLLINKTKVEAESEGKSKDAETAEANETKFECNEVKYLNANECVYLFL